MLFIKNRNKNFAIVGSLFFLIISAILLKLNSDLPSKSELIEIKIERPIKIFSEDNVLLGEIGSSRCSPVPYEKIPSQIINAFLAVEDNRFFEHSGVDIRALFRALMADFKAGKKVQGGSTITMQVARNFFLTQQKTYSRKIKEIILSYKIESLLSKKKF